MARLTLPSKFQVGDLCSVNFMNDGISLSEDCQVLAVTFTRTGDVFYDASCGFLDKKTESRREVRIRRLEERYLFPIADIN
jgi:hypothetical protein